MKPEKLDLDPTSPTAAKEWKHWKRTFDNIIAVCGEQASDKFRSIVNFISHNVFDYIEECTTYETAIETLKYLYVKALNEIFACHQHATQKQQSAESIDEFLQSLKKLIILPFPLIQRKRILNIIIVLKHVSSLVDHMYQVIRNLVELLVQFVIFVIKKDISLRCASQNEKIRTLYVCSIIQTNTCYNIQG